MVRCSGIVQRCCLVVITTAQLHSITFELRFYASSNPARGVSEICDGENLWQWPRLEIKQKTTFVGQPFCKNNLSSLLKIRWEIYISRATFQTFPQILRISQWIGMNMFLIGKMKFWAHCKFRTYRRSLGPSKSLANTLTPLSPYINNANINSHR